MSNQNMNPVGWFEIYVDDMERATKFYETVLQVTIEDLPMPDVEGMGELQMKAFPMSMEATGAGGALVKMQDFPAGGGSTIVYFSCEDCANEESRVAAAGGQVHQQKMSIGEYGFVSLVSDTEGNMIGLHSLK